MDYGYDSDNNDNDNAPFQCSVCYSSNFYRDNATDTLVCSECHTQSQSHSQREVLDDDAGFAGLLGTGGRMMTRNKTKRRKEDHELDNSKALPSVEEICIGLQTVLKLAAETAAILTGVPGSRKPSKRKQKRFQTAMISSVREIWFRYLTAWSEAAEYFAKLFPEVRFSFRDSCLVSRHARDLWSYLSAKTLNNYRNERKNGTTDPSRNIHNLDDAIMSFANEKMSKKRRRVQWDLDNSSLNARDDENQNIIESTTEKEAVNNNTTNEAQHKSTHYRFHRPPVTRIYQMLEQINLMAKDKDEKYSNFKKEAVLRLKPSMTLIASIVYLALLKLRTGVASYHITTWASNGSYPYILNAFVHLPLELQSTLKRVKKLFVNSMVPHPAEIDEMTDLLIIACGVSSDDSTTRKNNNIMMRDKQDAFAKIQQNNFKNYKRRALDTLLKSQNNNTENNHENKKEEKEVVTEEPLKIEEENNNYQKEVTTNIKQEEEEEKGHRSVEETIAIKSTVQHKREDNNDSDEEVRNEDNFYQDNIPMMACRFVTDLGLPQRVLDITLALMGLYQPDIKKYKKQKKQKKQHEEDTWLPKAIKGASPERMVSPLHVMAVIVVACKMCPNWEKWRICLSSDMFNSENTDTKKERDKSVKSFKRMKNYYNDDESWNSDEPNIPSLFCRRNDEYNNQKEELFKKNKDPRRQRFIPWDDDEINWLGHGKMLHDYLDFIEEIYGPSLPILKQYEDIIPPITDLYNKDIMKKHRSKAWKQKQKHGSLVVKPNTILAGHRNPNKPHHIPKKDKHFYNSLRCRHKGAIWADANGFGEYVIYKNLRSHSATKNALAKVSPKTTCEPFHPHYGLLIEFIADKISAEPSELHYLVASLDVELSSFSRPELDWNLYTNTAHPTKKYSKHKKLLKSTQAQYKKSIDYEMKLHGEVTGLIEKEGK